jgi:iron complex transport system substrate-binding protein
VAIPGSRFLRIRRRESNLLTAAVSVNNRKRLSLVLMLAQTVILFSMCSRSGHDSAPASIRVADFRSKEVSISRPAQRIVCLIESALTGLYMLHAGDKIIGIPASVYNESTKKYYAILDQRIASHQIPSPGNWDYVNIESVLSLRPDLVIIWASQTDAIASLEERGIPVYGVFMNRFYDVSKELRDFGILTGTQSRADSLIQFTEQEIALFQKQLPKKKIKPKVYFMWAQGPLETSGRESTVEELLTMSGAVNSCSAPQEHLIAHMEDVLRWNPDVIIQWHDPARKPQDIMEMDGWKNISAVRNGRVFQLPSAFLCDFWTLKYLIAAKYTASWCYPHDFSGINMAAEQERLLSFLYGDKGAELLQ